MYIHIYIYIYIYVYIYIAKFSRETPVQKVRESAVGEESVTAQATGLRMIGHRGGGLAHTSHTRVSRIGSLVKHAGAVHGGPD